MSKLAKALRSEFRKRVTEATNGSKKRLNGRSTGKIYYCGVIAQMGERLNGIQKVSGSIPLSSTIKMKKTG